MKWPRENCNYKHLLSCTRIEFARFEISSHICWHPKSLESKATNEIWIRVNICELGIHVRDSMPCDHYCNAKLCLNSIVEAVEFVWNKWCYFRTICLSGRSEKVYIDCNLNRCKYCQVLKEIVTHLFQFFVFQ